jgi:hypothetical protein
VDEKTQAVAPIHSHAQDEDESPGRKPGVTLWQYGEQILANWKDAEHELARSARWIVLFGVAQVLILLNFHEFRPASSTTSLTIFSVEVRVPGYALAIALPVVAAYWVSQYMHSWVSSKTLVTVHRAVICLLVNPGRPRKSAEGESPDPMPNPVRLRQFFPDLRDALGAWRIRDSGRYRGQPGNEADDLHLPLTPAGSVAGRLPTTSGTDWKDSMGPKWGGHVVVLGASLFEAGYFVRLFPLQGPWYLLLAWVGAVGFTFFWLKYAWEFVSEPMRWQQLPIEEMLYRLEERNAIER